MSKKDKRFNIPDPYDKLNKLDVSAKYSFGEAANRLNEIKQNRPVFAFDYISLKASPFCFNSNLIASKDYVRLLNSFKTLSTKSYDELSKDGTYHFHEVDFLDTTISISDFLKCLVPDISKINTDYCPTVYQFKAFEESRVFGFVYKTVFYLVLFDRNHKGYKRK